MQPLYFILLSLFLFCIGTALVLTKKNFILMLFGIEFIFNAANINMVTFDSINGGNSGQIFSVFIILIAACETVVALAIIIQLYKQHKHIDPSKSNLIKG